MVTRTFSLFMLIAVLRSSTAYKSYQYRIPNGDRVSHPCFPTQIWPGVGHFKQGGGGARNQFGKDFAANGRAWTEKLCRMDSDQDGRTNGEELGDPNCNWKKDSEPERSFNVTHPGVCDPFTSEKCKRINGNWNLCVSDKFNCSAIEEPGVTKYRARYKRTLVPTTVTNYYCQAFDFPTDDTYHLIASKPAIDNKYLMHNILVFGCQDRPDEDLFKKPRPCGMGGNKCQDVISIWGQNYLGDCLPEQFGIPVGKIGYKHIVMQYHWNNPMKLKEQYDATSMIFYLTKQMRPNHGGIFMAGQRYLEIPPGKSSVVQTSVCSSGCTERNLNQAINFTDIYAHMHYAGRMAEMLQYRDGTLIRTILPKTEVRYDEPQKFHIDPPAEVLPGDKLVTHCYFRSTGAANTVYYGDNTQDEMCYMFLNYYPQQNFTQCVDFGPVDTCMLRPKENGGNHRLSGWIDDCHVGNFTTQMLKTKWMPRITEFCDITIDVCRSQCLDVVKKLNKDEPCWRGWPRKYLDFISTLNDNFDDLKRLRLSIAPCERKLAVEEAKKRPPPPGKTTDRPGDEDNGGSSSMSTTFIVGCVVIAALLVTISVFGVLRAMKQKPSFREGSDNVIKGSQTNNYSFENKLFNERDGATNL